jgi:short-subunit dehydrogenase
MRRAIVIGASSGIGRELAIGLAKDGYALGIAARRVELLEQLRTELLAGRGEESGAASGAGVLPETLVQYMDVARPEESVAQLAEMIRGMGGVDLVILSSGIGHINPDLDWTLEKRTLEVNVLGITALVDAAMRHFLEAGAGHLVVLSSVAALRGSAEAPAYNASKAYLSNYLEGMRCLVARKRRNVFVTDVRPGLVDTAMAQGEGLFWVQPPAKAAAQILHAIRRKRRIVYVTHRWALVAGLLTVLPEWLYRKL